MNRLGGIWHGLVYVEWLHRGYTVCITLVDGHPELKRNRLVTCLSVYVCYRVSVDMGYDWI